MNGILLLPLFLSVCWAQDATKKNILFIVADDMRPDLGCYANYHPGFDSPDMSTPKIDKFAATSILFEKAFVQQALCSPSRTSFLTGRRPDTTRVMDISTYFRDVGGENITTIPQYFKENGYNSVGRGKIFHSGAASGDDNDGISWSDDWPYYNGQNNYRYYNTSYAVPTADSAANALQDTLIAQKAMSDLSTLASQAADGTPFFLAVGFRKPHLPWVYPESFLDSYPDESIELPDNPYVPTNMPDLAWYSLGELINDYGDVGTDAYPDIPDLGTSNVTYPDDKVKEMRQAYYASISYIDDLVGQILEELTTQGLDDSTVVAFLGDHGWQLGEHAEWCKNTNFEIAAHTPLIIRVPGSTDLTGEGITTSKLVEFVDIFPTLVEAAGMGTLATCEEATANDEELCTEGTSLIPLIDDPAKEDWKTAVFWQFPRGSALTSAIKKCMGYSIRTARYRYTEWITLEVGEDGLSYTQLWTELCDHAELYNLSTDPEENTNVYDDSVYNRTVSWLSGRLQSGWRGEITSRIY